MPHDAPLITTLAGGIVLAFLLGALANRLRISPIAGYLLAGIAVGPFTPGFVADTELAPQLAEVGVILLMFGVGLHFSLEDLLSVKGIAIPGAVVQIAAATALGVGLAELMGWSLGAGLVFGLCLSVASTVVLLRALEERGLVETRRGRIAVGWLIVEDLAMVVALVILPALAGSLDGGGPGTLAERLADPGLWLALALTLGKVALFVAIMLVVGRRAIPWLLARIVLTGSRELFTLAILAVALGVAFAAAELFGASFALGAFFAGMVLSSSDLSHDAAEEILPLRDAFAVLFFVSVGMLFDPLVLVQQPLPVLAVVLTIVVGKSLAALLIVLAFGHSLRTALTVSVSLAQVGEFSFILAGLGMSLGLLPKEGQDLILAGAIVSILLNPVLFGLLGRLEPWLEARSLRAAMEAEPVATPVALDLAGHVIVVGYGRVGRRAAQALAARGLPFVVVERRAELLGGAPERPGGRAIVGGAERPETLSAAGIRQAHAILVAIPNGYEAGRIVTLARELNPAIAVIARAHSDAEAEHLREQGAQTVLLAEHELADRMVTLAAGDRVEGADRQTVAAA
ncbi:YbaL family putative K(+) efflux transporter [Benzoatithermus flavus]